MNRPWDRQRSERRAALRADPLRALSVARQPLPALGPELDADRVSRQRVVVALVLHGAEVSDVEAVARCAAAVSAWGPAASLQVVQTDPAARHAFPGQLLRPGGFAQANNAAVGASPPGAWVLHTQADCLWGVEALRDAVGYALRWRDAGHPAPSLAPSGGLVKTWPAERRLGPQLVEVGRNVERFETHPQAVDWLAGYWLLTPPYALYAAGGWAEEFFLYWEDVDLSLRLAAAGARPVALPALRVDHGRSGSVSRVMGPPRREAIRTASLILFRELWRDGWGQAV